MGGVVRIGTADIGDLENHVGLFTLLGFFIPEGDADILHTVTVQRSVLEPVRVNCNFANGESIVGDTTGALVGKVVLARCPDVCLACRRIQLTFTEELHLPVLKAAEWKIDGPCSIDWGWDFGTVRWHARG